MDLKQAFNSIFTYLAKETDNKIISYLALRRLIGFLGILLSVVCIVGGSFIAGFPVEKSISFYYHTNMRDFFEGTLFGVALFLLTYKGYQRIDHWVTSLSGVACAGVAVFPCLNDAFKDVPIGIFQLAPQTSQIIHLSCAGVFFLLLALNSIFLFTKTGDAPKTENKKWRNKVYVICGVVILSCLLATIAAFLLINKEVLNHYKIILIVETIMLFAFGISWLVKGETLWQDPANV